MAVSKPSTRKLNFASLPPLLKLAVWIGAIALIAAAIQAVAWLAGLPFNVLAEGGGGRGVLLGVAVATLLLLMAADSRPAAGYGLAIGSRWHRHLLGGLALGAAVCWAYALVRVLAGAASLRSDLSASDLILCTLYSATTAFPLALTQQVIFSGYILGMLRARSSRLVAVIVPALLFALLRHLNEPAALLRAETGPEILGMFLAGALLGQMRLATGSVLLPTSFMTGCIFTLRVFRKTSLWAPAATGSDLVRTLMPGSDPLQSPLVWLVLGAAIGAYCLILMRKKEDPAPEAAGVDVGFMRVFPFSNISMLAPLDLWLGRLADARFRVGLKYVPRLAAIVTFSAVNTVLSLPERLLAPLLLRWRRVPDPVFIVGVHRSGTTHLHNLLALDPQFCAPRVYQIMNPAGFFTCSWLVTPLLAAFLPWRRPMDAVRFHIFAPQEDEFALSGVSRLSPYWGLTFPRRGRAYDRFIFPDQFTPAELRSWKGHLMLFLRKLVFWSGKRPLLKNPYNTARVAALRSIVPGARFVHVYRHPYDVYRSNMHMARQGHVVYQLQDPDESDSYATRFLDHYRTMEEAFYREAGELPPGQVAELAFEDLERDPIGQLRQIYARLGLEFTTRFEARLERYLESIADYQKNRFKPLADDVRREVDAAIGPFMARWGYDANGRTQSGGLTKAA